MPLIFIEKSKYPPFNGFLKIKYVVLLYIVVINMVIPISDFQKER